MEKLFDSELKVMEVLWREGSMTAGNIAAILAEEIGWNRNTTYTVIKKCVEKGVIKRTDPKFMCHALVTKEDVQKRETKELIDKMFDGSKQQFFTALVVNKYFSEEDIKQLKDLIDDME